MKKWIKVAFTLNMLGWFPFMWVALYGMNHREMTTCILVLGLVVCLFSAFALITLTSNKSFWMSQKEIEGYIEKHKISIKEYQKAKEKLIQKIENE